MFLTFVTGGLALLAKLVRLSQTRHLVDHLLAHAAAQR
jgi:hypothetical protein